MAVTMGKENSKRITIGSILFALDFIQTYASYHHEITTSMAERRTSTSENGTHEIVIENVVPERRN